MFTLSADLRLRETLKPLRSFVTTSLKQGSSLAIFWMFGFQRNLEILKPGHLKISTPDEAIFEFDPRLGRKIFGLNTNSDENKMSVDSRGLILLHLSITCRL